MKIYKVNDNFQNYMLKNYPEIHKYGILNDLLFYGIFVYYYFLGPIQDTSQNFLIVKYIIIILITRYLFNMLTNISDSKKVKSTYHQLNSKLAIFVIIILFLSQSNPSHVNLSTILIITIYTLLISSIDTDTSTVDNIYTSIFVLCIYSLKLL